MTRLLDSILGSDKDGMMYYAAQKRGTQPENPHSDRPRWAEMAPSRACGKTEPWSSSKAGIFQLFLPLYTALRSAL